MKGLVLLGAVVLLAGCKREEYSPAPPTNELVWVRVGDSTEKAAVPGGWIYWRKVGYGAGLTFVPTPKEAK